MLLVQTINTKEEACNSHAEAWVKGAPVIGDSTEKEICEFVRKYVTCRIPDSTLCPTLYEQVTTFQQHKCNGYCLCSKKTKEGVMKVCRFGYPRPQCESL